MSSTEQNPYDFTLSNMMLKIGWGILIVFVAALFLLSGTPPTMAPKNSAIRNMVGRIKTNATK